MHILKSFNTYNIITENLNEPINLCLIEVINDLLDNKSYNDIFENELITDFVELFNTTVNLNINSILENEGGVKAADAADAIVKSAASFWLSSIAFNELKNNLGDSLSTVLKNTKQGIGGVISKIGSGVSKGAGAAKAVVIKNPKTAVAAAAAAIVVGLAIKAYRTKVKRRLEVEKAIKAEDDANTREKLKAELEKLKAEEKRFKEDTKEKVKKAKESAVEKVEKDPGAAVNILKKGKAAADTLPE